MLKRFNQIPMEALGVGSNRLGNPSADQNIKKWSGKLKTSHSISHKKRQLLLLKKQIRVCQHCPKLVKSRSQAVPGYGDPSADVVFVGEAPGRLGADITGVPFTKDRSGVLLQKMLKMIGMNSSLPTSTHPKLKHAYITNLVRCNPRSSEGCNRSPSSKEVRNCREYLEKELEILDPKIVVTLGTKASREIIGNKFHGGQFGKTIKVGNSTIIPIYHPAFIIRGGGSDKINEKDYVTEFRKIKSLLSNLE